MGAGASNSRACSRAEKSRYSSQSIVEKLDFDKQINKDKEESKIKKDQSMKELDRKDEHLTQNDVMISYSHVDTGYMKKIKGNYFMM